MYENQRAELLKLNICYSTILCKVLLNRPQFQIGYLPQEVFTLAAPSVEAHHRVNGPNTRRNCGGRRIKKVVFVQLRW